MIYQNDQHVIEIAQHLSTYEQHLLVFEVLMHTSQPPWKDLCRGTVEGSPTFRTFLLEQLCGLPSRDIRSGLHGQPVDLQKVAKWPRPVWCSLGDSQRILGVRPFGIGHLVPVSKERELCFALPANVHWEQVQLSQFGGLVDDVT